MLQGPKVGSNVARSDRFFQCCKIRTLKMDLATTINIESQGQPTTSPLPPASRLPPHTNKFKRPPSRLTLALPLQVAEGMGLALEE